MDLHNGKLFWESTVKQSNHKNRQKPMEAHYDVVIIGAGVSGTLCAHSLAGEELRIALIDKNNIGSGSTSANTGLLQYSNDIMLHQLISQIGEEKAVRFYQLCLDAIDQLEEISNSLESSCDFIRRKSIYYASSESDVAKLQKEYEVLKLYHFPVEYWDRKKIESHFPFSKPAALITYRDAEVNPLQFSTGIVESLENKGVTILEQVNITKVEHSDNKTVKLLSEDVTLTASHVIFATGYSQPPLLDKQLVDLNNSFAIATQPISDLSAWDDYALIWETQRPYLYLRTTADGRIIAGGLDQDQPETPHSKDLINNRANKLKNEIEKLFPMLTIEIAYAWGALFGESIDNLPFIGKHPELDQIYYLLGYGGNGTVYSMIGANLLKDLILGHENRDANIVRLDR